MLVECTIKRKGGTRASIGKTNYHFEPDKDGRHVANVSDKAHLKAFLMIDAYQPFIEDEDEADDQAPEEDDEPANDGEGLAPEPADPEGDGDDEDDDTDPDGPPEEGDPDAAEVLEDMDHGQLIEAYTATFGKAPHPNTKADTLRAKLIEARDAKAE